MFLVATPFALPALIAVLFVREVPLRASTPTPAAASTPAAVPAPAAAPVPAAVPVVVTVAVAVAAARASAPAAVRAAPRSRLVTAGDRPRPGKPLVGRGRVSPARR